MADKDITIGLKTIADTTGAEKSEKSIFAVEDAAKQADRELDVLEAKRRLAASDTAAAFGDLEDTVRKTTITNETFTAGTTKMQAPLRNNSQTMFMFSEGLEQAGLGASGLLSNIPGLVIALGGTAGLAGAVGIVSAGLSQIIPLFTQTEEKASDMADKFKEIADNAGKLEAERFMGLEEGINIAADAADALKQGFTETKAASASMAMAGVEDATKLAGAQRTITELLGQQVDSYKEIEAASGRDAEKRKLAAQQQIDAEQQKLALAKDAVTAAGDRLGEKKALADTEQANLVTLRGQLATLREQRDELEKIAAGRGRYDQLPASLQDFSKKALVTSRGADDYKFAVDREAGRQAGEGSVLQAQIQAAEARVDQLAAAVETLTKDGGIVAKAENALAAAQTKVTDLTSAVDTNVQRIESTLATDTIVAKTDALAASSEKFATDIKTAAEKVETNTTAGQTAKDSILKAAEDGKITADEQAKVAQSLQVLMGQLQSGQATFSGNLRDLITLQQEFLKSHAQSAIQIQQLKVQAAKLTTQINQAFTRGR